MNVNNVRFEVDQRLRIEDGVLVKAAIFGRMEDWTKAGREQEEFPEADDFIGGGTAQNSDFDFPKPLSGSESSLQGSALYQYVIDGGEVKIEHTPMLYRVKPSPMHRSGQSHERAGTLNHFI